MPLKIIQRIQKVTGIQNLLELLTEKLSPSDLQSLLMEVHAERIAKLTPANILNKYQTDRYVSPATSDFLSQLSFDQHILELAKKMNSQPIELSPLAPLGVCSVVATAHQNKIVGTIRNSEVLSDCTNVLALECAVRRIGLLKTDPKNSQPIRLCTSHRLVRTQQLPDPRFLPHFKIFGMCSAGRDTGSFGFEINGLKEHLEFYLELMSEKKSGYCFQKIEVLVTELNSGETAQLIETKIFAPLKVSYPNVRFQFFPERESGRGYYQELCFQVNAENKNGQHFLLADGGFTDWTQQYLNNKKERLLISGIGTELICLHFGK